MRRMDSERKYVAGILTGLGAVALHFRSGKQGQIHPWFAGKAVSSWSSHGAELGDELSI
jgi:hypothetical protein